jgi:hypothetical protein
MNLIETFISVSLLCSGVEFVRSCITIFYLNIGGGVYTGSTRHCGHYWPIVPAPGDCEDREFGGINGFGRGN